ncbi:MAG: CDP-diacylglycerol--glycerol-3-phosphate 3-phosphatidyltransferase, partial [Bacillus amyloliquefaciens]
MFNLPNKITLARIALIPVFMIIMLVPFQWGSVHIGDESIPVAHLTG